MVSAVEPLSERRETLFERERVRLVSLETAERSRETRALSLSERAALFEGRERTDQRAIAEYGLEEILPPRRRLELDRLILPRERRGVWHHGAREGPRGL